MIKVLLNRDKYRLGENFVLDDKVYSKLPYEREEQKLYFHTMEAKDIQKPFKASTRLTSLLKDKSLINLKTEIIRFYFYLARSHAFVRVNNSIYMSLVNTLLCKL